MTQKTLLIPKGKKACLVTATVGSKEKKRTLIHKVQNKEEQKTQDQIKLNVDGEDWSFFTNISENNLFIDTCIKS